MHFNLFHFISLIFIVFLMGVVIYDAYKAKKVDTGDAIGITFTVIVAALIILSSLKGLPWL